MRYEELSLLEIGFMAFLIVGAVSAAFGIMGYCSDYLFPRYTDRAVRRLIIWAANRRRERRRGRR